MALRKWNDRGSPMPNLEGRRRARGQMDTLLRAAAFLPPEDRRVFRAAVIHQRPALELAQEARVGLSAMLRRIRGIHRRLTDPCFLLTVRFARKLPEPLALTARLYFQLGFSLSACAQTQGIALHAVRRHVLLARALLIQAAARRYGGTERTGQLFLAAVLGALPAAERLRRIAAAEAA